MSEPPAPDTAEARARREAEVPAFAEPPRVAVVACVSAALAEDLLPLGDLSASLLPPGATAKASFVARAGGVLAGTACAREAAMQVDPSLEVTWRVVDGQAVQPGDPLGSIEGLTASILAVERSALNFLCHLSGVATLTRRYVEAARAADPSVTIWDTRKTTPGLRALEKAAVRAGGGLNHRGSLSEAVLVKDNHLGAISIADAVARARARWPGRMVEVECDRVDQVHDALQAGATLVMCDNMSPDEVRQCVGLVRAHLRRAARDVLIEASGGIDLANIAAFASAGVDLISVGALTHSAPALDIGLDLDLEM